MKRMKRSTPALIAALGLAALAATMAIADPSKEAAPAGQPEMKLPPGWTQEDMEACMIAGTPGKMHEQLAKGVGVWKGRNTMWMGPGAESMTGESTMRVKSIMDGRYIQAEMAGELPGMPAYKGLGFYGFDNVVQKFVSTWIDNHGTGMANGTGELSEDGKTLTWKFTYNCPVTKKPAVLREVETITGENTKKLEMFGKDPKSGKEFKMMSIELTRES